MRLEHTLTQYTKVDSRWIGDLVVRPDAVRLSEKDMGRTLYDINHSKILFDSPPGMREVGAKVNKGDLMELGSFYTARETRDRTKGQPSEWEKIFANEATDGGLISRIFRQLVQLNITKANNTIQGWVGDLSGHFPMGDKQMAGRFMEGCSASLVIGEVFIRTTVGHCLTPVRVAITKKI